MKNYRLRAKLASSSIAMARGVRTIFTSLISVAVTLGLLGCISAGQQDQKTQAHNPHAASTNTRTQAAKTKTTRSNSYIDQITNYLYQNWQPTKDMDNYTIIIAVKVDQKGRVQGTPMIKHSSGNTEFDEDAIIAIMRASPLPMPNEALVRQQLIQYGFEIMFTPQTSVNK